MQRININFKTHITAAIPLIVLAVSLLVAFRGSIAAMYTHGITWHFLIPPIALLLAWKQGSWPDSKKLKGNTLAGVVLVVTAFVILFTGQATSTLVITELAIVVAVWGCVLFIGGFSLFSSLLWSLIYLLFISSLLEGMFDMFTEFFKYASANLSVQLSKLIGLSILHSRTYIRLPTMVLNVADECSGINHLVSLVVISLPLAVLTQKRIWTTIAVIVSAVPIALFSNSLRVFFLIAYNYARAEFSHGPNNVLVTSSGFFIGLLMLYGLTFLLSKVTHATIASSKENNNSSSNFNQLLSIISKKHVYIISLVMLCGFVLVSVWSIKHADQPALFSQDLSINEWKHTVVTTLPEVTTFPATDNSIAWRFEDESSNHLFLYCGWYSKQEQNREAQGYLWDRLFRQYSTYSQTTNSGNTIGFKVCNTREKKGDYLYYITYRTKSKYGVSPLKFRLNILLDAILHRSTAATIIIIAVPANDVKDGALPEYANTFLQKMIPEIEPLFD